MAPVSVLIVEDENDLLTLFKTILSRIMPLESILTASGGEEAIRILENNIPNLVMLDLAMPHVSGNQVIHYMVSQPRLDATQVLVVSAVPMRLSEEGSRRAARVLIKPVIPHDLEVAVRELLGSSNDTPSP